MSDLLDTNVLLRFLVGDNHKQQEEAKKWFAEGEKGKRKIIVKPLVVAETCFVLESFYKKERNEIADALEIFLSQKWLVVNERDILLGLLPYYRENRHFVDSYLLSYKKINQANILSFDKRLNRLI